MESVVGVGEWWERGEARQSGLQLNHPNAHPTVESALGRLRQRAVASVCPSLIPQVIHE